jgi:hypothetical protein
MGRVNVRQVIIWTGVAILGAVAWGFVALARGEQVNAIRPEPDDRLSEPPASKPEFASGLPLH